MPGEHGENADVLREEKTSGSAGAKRHQGRNVVKHQEIIESLPWYVNGTLSQTERAEIAQHLAAGCRECAQEVASLTALRKAVVAVGDQAPEPSPYLLNRALAQIEDYERTRSQAENRQKETAKSSPSWLAEMSAIWGRKTPVFARLALAVQMALLLAVGTIAVYEYNRPPIVYKVSTGSQAQGTGATVGVTFNENASERDIPSSAGRNRRNNHRRSQRAEYVHHRIESPPRKHSGDRKDP